MVGSFFNSLISLRIYPGISQLFGLLSILLFFLSLLPPCHWVFSYIEYIYINSSLLLLKVIDMLANFLILPDTLLLSIFYVEGKIWWNLDSAILLTNNIWSHSGIKYHSLCVYQVMLDAGNNDYWERIMLYPQTRTQSLFKRFLGWDPARASA